MKKISFFAIILGVLSIIGIVYQNYRLASMYRVAYGKTKALFGIRELSELDIKVYIGLIAVLGLVLGFIAIRKKENKFYSICAITINITAISLLFLRIWIHLI